MTSSLRKMSLAAAVALLLCFSVTPSEGFAPIIQTTSSKAWQTSSHAPPQSTTLHMFDPVSVLDGATMFLDSGMASVMDSASNFLSFADQGQNLAGIFFQASLLPYLAFLYFLSFRANRLSDITNFGFQFVLLFVASTIPSGIVSKATYGTTLANVDWLHGGAELLLTVANVFIVLGLTENMTNTNPPALKNFRNVGLGLAAAFFGSLAIGPSLLGIEAHAPFLLGIGDLSSNVISEYLPFVSHAEPENALSIPTWAIHFSSVLEYLFAMNLVWRYSETTGNETWKALTWGMLPLHASGVCACTYHFFYNPPELQFLVSTQAGLTFLGNLTCAIAAFLVARSNGWTLDEVNPFPKSSTSPAGLVADGLASQPLMVQEPTQSKGALVAQLVGATLFLSYAVKYGELGLDLPFTPNAPVALAMIIGIPAITALQYYNLSQEGGGFSLNLPSFGGGEDGKPGVSMEDVKKYGVAGTVAYILTELAFWVVAFPVAGCALYESTGHWPDVINEPSDRTAVLGFIFAGANIARAFVPVRLGAALALAPWVDENLLNRDGGGTIVDVDATNVEQ